MPQQRHRSKVVRMSNGAHPNTPPELRPVALAKETWGWDSLPGEDPKQVLGYDGWVDYGTNIRNAAPQWAPWNGFYQDAITTSTPWLGGWYGNWQDYLPRARNKAYSKFKDSAIGESSQLGTFIAEGRESYGMIANRATGLYRAYKALRRGDFRKFCRELSVKPKRKHRSVVRTAAGEASGIWLEYWFGWSPSIGDLYNAYQVLTGFPESGTPYRGATMERLPERSSEVINFYSACRREACSAKVIVKTGADVKLVNPNAAIRASLGLNNPAAIAWEVVPFSFVVDWFTQFGNCINAMTDFAGFELSHEYTTTFLVADRTHDTWYWEAGRGANIVNKHRIYRHVRANGLVQPKPLVPRLTNFGTSATRTATAVSLLTAIFLDR